jgi:predicted nucleic acid-binding protein
MPLVFLDTNVIVRFLTDDDQSLAARARVILERAERGGLTLYLTEAVLVDVAYLLTSKRLYDLPRPAVVASLRRFLTLKGLRVPQRRAYLRALDLWLDSVAGVDFTDALLVAQMERMNVTAIASFDRDFDRFPQVSRLDD